MAELFHHRLHLVRQLALIGLSALAISALGVWIGCSRSELPDVDTARAPIAAVDHREMVGPCAVTRFVDGDTVDIACAGVWVRVRLLNIDTPERGRAGFHEATEALRQMAEGRTIYLVYEYPYGPSRGRYGRLLAYLYADELNINLEMVREGWTPFYTKFGAGRFPAEFMQAEAEAMRGRRGLWSVD